MTLPVHYLDYQGQEVLDGTLRIVHLALSESERNGHFTLDAILVSTAPLDVPYSTGNMSWHHPTVLTYKATLHLSTVHHWDLTAEEVGQLAKNHAVDSYAKVRRVPLHLCIGTLDSSRLEGRGENQ